MADTYDTGGRIPCPHGCGGFTVDLWDFQWSGDEDEEKQIECGTCERTIMLRRTVSVTYKASAVEKKEGG